jgi:hypothetical protein
MSRFREGKIKMEAERDFKELLERNRMLSDIALSAVCLKLNIENGFPPTLDALNRDLAAFERRFGGHNAGHESTDKPGHKGTRGRRGHRRLQSAEGEPALPDRPE